MDTIRTRDDMDDYRLTEALLCGQDESLMVDVLGCPVHPAIVAPFEALRSDAARAGFELKIVSGFRGFDRQLAIWNAKASGRRPLLDSDGQALCFNELSCEQLLDAILRWSALPGASRHHWGSGRRPLAFAFQIANCRSKPRNPLTIFNSKPARAASDRSASKCATIAG